MSTEPTWVHIDTNYCAEGVESRTNLPTVSGHYRVMIHGDSESVDGHVIYEFGDYETWAYIKVDENGISADLNEDFDCVFAWCGPFIVPKYERSAV